jgi:hypothetical protein
MIDTNVRELLEAVARRASKNARVEHAIQIDAHQRS